MSKDLWFDAMVERQAELEDQGIDPDTAYNRACEEASGIVAERLADHADYLRKARRENGE